VTAAKNLINRGQKSFNLLETQSRVKRWKLSTNSFSYFVNLWFSINIKSGQAVILKSSQPFL